MADALAKLPLPWDVAPPESGESGAASSPAPAPARMESVLRGLRPSAAPCGGAQEAVATATTQGEAAGFFTLGQVGGRWVLLTPDRKPFFSLGLNHIDAATLRTVENGRIWREKYGNSMHRWLDESVRVKLKEWGFNTCGWSQESVAGGRSLVIHSRPWTYDEYQSLDTRYCHLLPFTEIHQWEPQTKHPDFHGAEFWQACDYVAREHCAAMRDDPNLIGYWYSDCPTWVHNRGSGPLFDGDLETAEGRSELQALATQYYKVLHDAVRRYDPHHLILGDRYEANAPLPMEVVEAAKPYVDVLAFQDFSGKVCEQMQEWHTKTGMPVLWADGARPREVSGYGMAYSPERFKLKQEDPNAGVLAEGYGLIDGGWYAEQVAGLRENPGCIGAHLCGAFMRNRARRVGLLDEEENEDLEATTRIAACNKETEEWVAGLAQ
jgi:hypothetical protein